MWIGSAAPHSMKMSVSEAASVVETEHSDGYGRNSHTIATDNCGTHTSTPRSHTPIVNRTAFREKVGHRIVWITTWGYA